jgi:WD40 repeat protein
MCMLAGVVALWDVTTGQQLSEYEAHEKRIWTVDFCHSDPMHFVSGSDDGWVKVRSHPRFWLYSARLANSEFVAT